jgi:hypothetical protein
MLPRFTYDLQLTFVYDELREALKNYFDERVIRKEEGPVVR